MDAILRMAKEHRLKAIEDAAESLGALYGGRYTGTLGDFGCHSFNGNKVITTGGGGMVIDNNNKENERIKYIVNQCKRQKDERDHQELGFNYRMMNLEAAFGLAQLSRLDEFLAKKRTFRRIYEDQLQDVSGRAYQKECKTSKSSWWLSCIRLEKARPENIINALGEKGIP